MIAFLYCTFSLMRVSFGVCFSVVRRSANTSGQGPLNLEWINYCFTKNGQKHRSDMYYCMNERNPTLVVRRGLPICFYLKFDREFDITTDYVSFMFKLTGNYFFICSTRGYWCEWYQPRSNGVLWTWAHTLSDINYIYWINTRNVDDVHSIK